MKTVGVKRPREEKIANTQPPLKKLMMKRCDSTGSVVSDDMETKKLMSVQQRNAAYISADTFHLAIGKVCDAQLHITKNGKTCIIIAYLSGYSQFLRRMCNERTRQGAVYMIKADDFCIDYIMFCYNICHQAAVTRPNIYPSDFMSLIDFMDTNGMPAHIVKKAINDTFSAIIRETKHFEDSYIDIINTHLVRGLKSFVYVVIRVLISDKCTSVLPPLDENMHFAKILIEIATRCEITVKITGVSAYNAIVQELRTHACHAAHIDDAYNVIAASVAK